MTRKRAGRAYERFVRVLEGTILPGLVRYSTHPLHLAGAVVLWLLLLVGGSITLLALTGGNYFNGLCGIVSCALLAKQMQHQQTMERRHAELLTRHDGHEAEIARLHAKVDAAQSAKPRTRAKVSGKAVGDE